MANKRNLNRRQKWRIDKIQEERIKRAKNKNSQIENLYELEQDTEQSGLVIQHYGKTLAIEEPGSGDVFRCTFRQNLGNIVCGDKVVWQKIHLKDGQKQNSEQLIFEGIVTAIMERDSLLARPDPYGKKKTIAANIDQILIITSPLPLLNRRLIDRYLVAAEVNQIQPIIVLNKIDLLADNELEIIKDHLSIYPQLDYPVIYTSVNLANGLDQLKKILSNKKSILVGQSGVGKSSLVNILLPEAQAKTGAISEATGKGKHTTSAAVLYHLLQSGIKEGCLIDSPGIREFGLWDIKEEEVEYGFKEIHAISGQCRYRNCRHINEPQCAILEAVDNNKIDTERFESFRQIIDSL